LETPPVVARVSFHGWDGIRLSNGLIDAIAVPEIGGRLMQFSLGPYQYLFANPELLGKRFTFEEHAGDGSLLAWKNYGGDKTWPAPQGWERNDQWPGPPDPVLDSGRYEAQHHQTDHEASVTMISPPDDRTGLRIHRKLTLFASMSRLRLDLTFENVSERAIRWSIWDVAQLDCSVPDGGANTDCWLYIPTDSSAEAPYRMMFGENNAQFHTQFRPGLMAVHYQGIVSKIGVHSPAGWLAFANQQAGYILQMRFAYERAGTYPDDGATVECWTESPGAPSPIPIRSPGYLMEAEILSPMYLLQPGERVSHTIAWSAAFCPGPIVDATEVGCIHQPLQATTTPGNWAHLSGVFGCFMLGRAALVWLDDARNVLRATDIGQVSPLATLNINRIEPPPPGAAQVQIDIFHLDGTPAGTLASAVVGHQPQIASRDDIR
jgi:hypothetical protein